MERLAVLIAALAFAISLSFQLFTSHAAPSAVREFDVQFDPSYAAHFTVDANSVTIRATVQTDGWVGFGLSPNGVMEGADIFIAGVKSGGSHQTYSGEYTGVEHTPQKANSHNWQLISAKEDGKQTVVEFKRLFNPGDNDKQIEAGETTVIWSYSETDDLSTKHKERGSQSVVIRQDDIKSREAEDEKSPGATKGQDSTNQTNDNMNNQDSESSSVRLTISYLLMVVLLCSLS